MDSHQTECVTLYWSTLPLEQRNTDDETEGVGHVTGRASPRSYL